MIETNVLGLMRMTRLCLPHIHDGGHIVNIGSVAGRQAYENAAGYVASKFAVRGFTYAFREDLLGRPIHLTTVDPGLVETEFSLVRFRGDEEKAKSIYEGVQPLTPQDVAECVLFAVTRPQHVNVDELVVKALAQSNPTRIARENGRLRGDHDPRRVELLHQRPERRLHVHDERALRVRHALPVAPAS